MLVDLVAAILRRTWLLVLVTILTCSVFAARATAAFIDGETRVDTPPAMPPANTHKPQVAHSRRGAIAGEILVERNIFCSSCVPKRAVGAAGAVYTGEAAVLIATSLGGSPRATVRVVATEAQGSWAIGEKIPRVGTITRIGGSTIDVIDEAGNTGTLSLLDGSGGRAETAAATAGSAAPTPEAPFADRIQKLGDMQYKVDRELVRELVSGTTQAKGVRALPVMKGGEVQGLRLTGVKADSVAAAVGIKSGDVFDAIDGVKIKQAQQLLDLFTKLDSVSAVELTGTRGAKPLALKLELR